MIWALGDSMLTNAIGHNCCEIIGLAASAKPLVARLLTGQTEGEDPLRVDVHVRSYDDSATLAPATPALRPQAGPLPVGTLLDCYV